LIYIAVDLIKKRLCAFGPEERVYQATFYQRHVEAFIEPLPGNDKEHIDTRG
jgi:hypothetical protein